MTTVERLPDDVARAYLERLELDLRPGEMDAPALHELQRAHLERVPFETLDIVRGHPPGIDPLASARRILGGLGGYCYHLNGAYSALLAWLEVDVTRHLAGVYGGTVQEPQGPNGNHLGLTARTPDGRTWLVDVGLGDGPAEPLELVEGEHVQGGARYRLGPSPFGADVWRFGHEENGGFVGFDVSTKTATMNEFEEMHRHLSTRTRFATTVTAQLRTGDGLVILRGCHYTERFTAGIQSREVTAEVDWWELVTDRFGLSYGHLSRRERSDLWQRVLDVHASRQDASAAH